MHDPTALTNRLRKTARHRRKWARRTGTDAYRLYDRDIPEIPLAIDWYAGRVHVAEYAPRRDEERAADWLEPLLDAVCEALGTAPRDVFVKRRERQRGSSQYERFDDRTATSFVREADLRFEVNLSDYLDTGLFLDHRPLRARVGEESAGADVLNLFAYTGSFSVHAAAGGARSTLSVDLSTTYLDWAARNLAHNELAQPEHRQLRADVTAWLANDAPREAFDIVVLDPPTFSNSKRMDNTFDVQRDHVPLIQDALRTLRRDGVLYFSTNRRKFRLDVEGLGGIPMTEITSMTVPEDFARSRPHRCWRIGG